MKYFTCPELEQNNIKHGFFSRQGGVSRGLYQSLNAGIGSDDTAEDVTENRKRVQQELSAKSLLTLYQIHSNKVVIADENTGRIEADAMVTTTPNIAIGVLTADCVPVLFADYKNGVIGAAHAGWKGAISGITDNIIAVMLDCGAKLESIIACIGPCIGAQSYEVGEDLYAEFIKADKENARFFIPADASHTMSSNEKRKTGGFSSPKRRTLRSPLIGEAGAINKHFFDIVAYVKDRLNKSGVQHINHITHDTYSNEGLFYSYRRSCHHNEPDYGRQISAICLK